ncbi:uncharacterized protein TNCV_2251951 [Trichonephila clavipes]|nr:uncharacterized protein TNCV_2251951 [Trichonephila clavipes]
MHRSCHEKNGTRLRRLQTKMRGQKLSDGKPLCGRNRLTEAEIDRLQAYYGLAIRRNLSSVKDMQQAIWAIFLHKLSTDEKPQHGFCPSDSDTWCKFKKAELLGETYHHKNSLPVDVVEAMRPVFRDLANPELLKNCLHGGETYIQFAARLTANFQYYCSLRKVNSFESLCDLIISDKLFETLNKETATHIGIREAEDWFRPIDLAKECDIYISSRGGSRKEIPITYGYTQDPFKNRSRNFKPEIKENYPQYLERENKNCFIYAVIHLITQETVRSVLNLKNLTNTSIIE